MTTSLLFPCALSLDGGASVNSDSLDFSENLALFRPKLRDSYQSDCEICELLFLRRKCNRNFRFN